jgi:hypothetical protein
MKGIENASPQGTKVDNLIREYMNEASSRFFVA